MFKLFKIDALSCYKLLKPLATVGTTPYIVFSVTIWIYAILELFTVYLIFCQQRSN